MDARRPEFVPDSFEQLYPVFLLRKIAPGTKAALWDRYQGKWVHWTGKLIAITQAGALVKMRADTVTYDVSLRLEDIGRVHLTRYRVGDSVSFVGTLDRFDDVVRTLYLAHGDVPPPGPGPGDLPPLRESGRRR